MNPTGIKPGIKVKDCDEGLDLRKTFLKQKFEVASFNTLVKPGNYVFPFKLPVDPMRPASVSCPDLSGKIELIKIYYKLKASVNFLDPNLVHMPVKHKIPIELLQPIPLPIVPAQVHMDEMINSIRCFRARNLKCTAITDKNAYALGDNVKLTLLVDASDLDKDVDIFVTMNRFTIINNRPAMPPLNGTIQELELPSVPAGEKIQHCVMMPIPYICSPSNLSGIFAKWYFFLNITFTSKCRGTHQFKMILNIYAMPNLRPIPPITFPSDQEVEVRNGVVLDQSKVLHPY